jgi:hypothetical protein
MAHPSLYRVALAVAVTAPVASFADRPPEDRAKASHVVVGRVEGVYAQEGAARATVARRLSSSPGSKALASCG